MKYITLIPILIISLISCKKEVTEQVQTKYELTATMTVKVTPETLFYDVFVQNNKTAPINLWLFVKRIYKSDLKTNPFTFGFDAPTVCYLTIDANKEVYGMIRTTNLDGTILPYDFENIIIHN